MDANWVAAIASVASAAVVAVTAVAAFVQIRHVRNANDITIYLRLVDRLDAPESRTVFPAIEAFAERLATDADLRTRMTGWRGAEEFWEIESFVIFLEHLSTLVLTGGLSERLILAEYADSIVELWDGLAESIYLRRCGSRHYGAAYEHLAMRAKAYLTSGEMDRFYGRLRRDPRMAGFEPPG
jgi:hypothetical protein